MYLRLLLYFLAVPAVFLTAGCSSDSLSSEQRLQELAEHRADRLPDNIRNAETVELSQSDAITMALQNNLDLRVSALEVLSRQDNVSLEKLSAMPEFNIVAGYQGRSNPGASSSRSLLTGRESLEPSISTDRYRKTTDLDLRWNIIDVALAVSRSRSADNAAKAAAERHRAMQGKIVQDAMGSYERAYAAQISQPALDQLVKQADTQIENIEKAQAAGMLSLDEAEQSKTTLLRELQEVNTLLKEASLAETELKGLLSLPPQTRLILKKPADSLTEQVQSYLSADAKILEEEALAARPEMQETLLNEKIAREDIQQEILRTIPGAEIFTRLSSDSNSFLEDSRWLTFSVSVAQNLAAVFTLPARYRSAQNRETLEKERSLAMSIALITQTHLARAQLRLQNDAYSLASREEKYSNKTEKALRHKKAEGFSSGQEALLASLKAETARLRAGLAKAQLQDALSGMAISLGKIPGNARYNNAKEAI